MIDAPTGEREKKYTNAEHLAYGLIAFGLVVAAIATIVAWVEINPVAMVLSAFGWFGTGAVLLKHGW